MTLRPADYGHGTRERKAAASAARSPAPTSSPPPFCCSNGGSTSPGRPAGGRGDCAAGADAVAAICPTYPLAGAAEEGRAASPSTAAVGKGGAACPSTAAVVGELAVCTTTLAPHRRQRPPRVEAAGRPPPGHTALRVASRPPPDHAAGLAPPPKRSRPDWVGAAYVIQRAALAMTAPFMFAVLSARAGELPDPRRALGVIQQMRLALLCTDDAPGEDSANGTGTALWTQATESSTASLHAAQMAFSDPLLAWPPPLETVPPTREITDELAREWWRRRVRRFIPDAAWARLVR
eukprot:COSAG04_NODE_1451_length_6686_cov_13.172435_6_plen_293_part_00